MPRTRSLGWAELKIGLLTVFALFMTGALIFMLSGSGGLWWQRYPMKTMFNNVAGLGEGAPVRVAGVEVGTVTGVELRGNRVEVLFEVNEDLAPRITSASRATLGSVSLLGESAVDITPATEGQPIPEWGYVPSVPATGTLADVATSASKSLEEATQLIEDIRAGRGTVGKLFTDDALYREINSFVGAAEDVARNLSQGRGTIGRLTSDPTAARALEGSLQNLEAVTARIRSGEGSIGRLLNDDALAKTLSSTTANLDAITGRISKGEGTAGKLVTDAELYNRLNSMADRLDKVTAGLQQGDGTAGQLLRDKQLYENMNGTVSELRQLVQDIRADPRKYLNVRVSLF
jgi:phospholipid/cholesterol/gamma-HCH transport system substrate-binding protein